MQQAVYIIVQVVRTDFGIDVSYLFSKTRVCQDVVNEVILYRITVVSLAQHYYIRFIKQLEYVFLGRHSLFFRACTQYIYGRRLST